MRTQRGLIGNLTTKLIACLLIVICFAVGAVGLVLPVIPGLLFLAIALMIVARYFPSIDRRLRRNRTIGSYLESSDGFGGLSFGKKIQYGCLLCLRLFVDAVAFVVYAVSKLLGFAVVKYQSYR
ncbi:MAG TPA: DUF454 family protein [Gammaproteobacteria bacterium]|nr:DUF454 family protein [Gammaproteobacteria bacterium]